MDKKVKLNVDIIATLQNFQNETDKIQQSLNKLNIPSALSGKFKNATDSIQDDIQNLLQYTENNEFELVDEKEINKSFDRIKKNFISLIKDINANSAKIGIFGDANINKLISDYQDKLLDKQSEIQQKKQEKTNRQTALNAYKKQSAKYLANQTPAGVNKTKLDTGEKLFAYYQKQHSNLSEAQALTYWTRSNEGKEYKDTFKNKDLINKEYLKAVAQAGIDRTKTINDLEDKAKKATTELSDLEQQLQDIQTTDFSKLKADLEVISKNNGLDLDISSISNLDDLQKSLDEINNSGASKELTNVLAKAKELVGQTREYKTEIDDASEGQKEFNSQLENIQQGIKNFFGLENAINLVKRAISDAFDTVKELDAAMTEAAVVTDFSISDMWEQLPEYTQRANELGVSLLSAYNSMAIFYQQGLDTNEAIALSNETLKMARIASLDAEEATERMTNALRGFNLELNEVSAQRVDDVYNKLAA